MNKVHGGKTSLVTICRAFAFWFGSDLGLFELSFYSMMSFFSYQPAPLDLEQALQQAINHHQLGQLQNAERIYRDILEIQPNHPDANHNLGVLAVQMKQPSVGLPHFKAALDADPRQSQYWISYIDALIRAGQRDVARKVFMQGLETGGLQGEAVEALEGRLDGPSSEEINHLVTLFDHGRYNEAKALAEGLTERFPKHGFGWKILGAALQKLGRIEEALVPVQKSVELLSTDAGAQNNLGVLLRMLKRLTDAELSYRRAIELNPNYADAHSNLAICLKEQGRYEDAIASCYKALLIDPASAGAHTNLATILREQGRLIEAESSSRRALEFMPNMAEAHNALGAALQAQRRLAEAEFSLRRALELNPDLADVHSNLGITLLEQGRLHEAESSLHRAVELNPNLDEVHNNLGVALKAQGQLNEALAAFRSGLSLLMSRAINYSQPPRTKAYMDIETAHRALNAIKTALDAEGIPFFLAYGTLLGIIRDKELLPHDKDMDLGLPWDLPRKELVNRLVTHGFVAPKTDSQTEVDRAWCITFAHAETGITIDLFFFKPDGATYLSGFNHAPVPLLWRFESFELEPLVWQGQTWRVPSPPTRFLENIYGPNWTEPDPYFDSIVSGKNRTPESLSVALCYAYNRLYDRVQRREWKKAAGYCRQIQAQQPDPFITELESWIEARIKEMENSAA